MDTNGQSTTAAEVADKGASKSINVLLGKGRRAYDVADKGILWGWEVSAYVTTKAIAAGAFLVPFLAVAFGWSEVNATAQWFGLGLGLVFLAATGLLLIKDLDRPDRFLNVLLRPHWNSWLVKGGYSISVYGGLLTLLGVATWLGWNQIIVPTQWLTAIVAVVVAVYTAFLFAQAKGRDFWQSPTLSIHMLVHSFMAGAASFGIINLFVESGNDWSIYLNFVLFAGIGINLFTILIEMMTTHPTKDAKLTVEMILKGRYRNAFWFGTIILGNILPLFMLVFSGLNPMVLALAGIFVLIGIYITEHIWVEAPQRIPLS